jgi:processive 1,2-diacylglycerol beta-glucosyltransferase
MNGGNGTMSASQALMGFFRERGVDCAVTDFMEDANPLGFMLGNVYNSLLKRDLRFASIYMGFAHRFPINKSATLVKMGRQKIIDLIDREASDILVMICPWIPDTVMDALKHRKGRRPVTCTVVVDLGVGVASGWYNKDVDVTIFPTSDVEKCFRRQGRESSAGLVLGMPLSSEVVKDDEAGNEFRERSGISGTLCTILGGREGSRNVLGVLDSLLKSRFEAEIAVQCGENKQLFKAVKRRKGVKPFGFLDSLISLLKASDAVITKPGALTISELVALKKPFVLDCWPAVMPQERGNVEFVRNMGLGLIARNHSEIPSLAQRIIEKKVKLSEYDIYGTERIGNAILELGRKHNYL